MELNRMREEVPRIEDERERSRVLVLCMSASVFGSYWAQLESGTFPFRDPLNKGSRFIPIGSAIPPSTAP